MRYIIWGLVGLVTALTITALAGNISAYYITREMKTTDHEIVSPNTGTILQVDSPYIMETDTMGLLRHIDSAYTGQDIDMVYVTDQNIWRSEGYTIAKVGTDLQIEDGNIHVRRRFTCADST